MYFKFLSDRRCSSNDDKESNEGYEVVLNWKKDSELIDIESSILYLKV